MRSWTRSHDPPALLEQSWVTRRSIQVALPGSDARTTACWPQHDASCSPAAASLALQPVTLGSISTQLVATAGADATVRIWCSTTGRQLQLLSGHSDRATAVAWSPCGCLLASASLDGTARLWGLRASLLGCCHVKHTPCSGEAAASSNIGKSGGPEQLLVALAVLSGQEGRVSCLDFSPDGTWLATGTSEGQVWLWPSADSSQQDSNGAGSAAGSAAGGSGSSSACAFGRKLGGHGGLVSALAFSPCGRLLASASGGQGNAACCMASLCSQSARRL